VKAVPRLARRRRDAHKGDFGYVLVVGGSRGMAGAVVLAAQSAMRAGAGKCTAAVPEHLYPVVAGRLTVCTTVPLPEHPNGTFSLAAAERLAATADGFHVLALGPGLGHNPDLVRLVVQLVRTTPLPMVLDADGLNCLSRDVDALRDRPAPTVLTPHPKEMARLTGLETSAVQADRIGAALSLARRTGAVVALKGHATVVADAGRYYVNTTGNPAMATGGSGDVLTGVVAAFIGQGLSAFDAAVLGVYIHGLAGDLARHAIGEVGVIASDLTDHLPAALRYASRSTVAASRKRARS
jgi:hydroxyethylthiazole kinase-like uncharacterized protein yjeF